MSFVHFFSHHLLFNGQGKLNNQQIKLHIREDVKPVMQRRRRIPYHVRKEVSKELNKLTEQDIIEKVADQPIPLISLLVVTRKKDGSTRIYTDMREADQAMEKERHIMPTLQDVQAEVNEAKSFSKIHLKQAYRHSNYTRKTDSSPHSPHSKGYSSTKD